MDKLQGSLKDQTIQALEKELARHPTNEEVETRLTQVFTNLANHIVDLVNPRPFNDTYSVAHIVKIRSVVRALEDTSGSLPLSDLVSAFGVGADTFIDDPSDIPDDEKIDDKSDNEEWFERKRKANR